jgi:hypothetical protein
MHGLEAMDRRQHDVLAVAVNRSFTAGNAFAIMGCLATLRVLCLGLRKTLAISIDMGSTSGAGSPADSTCFNKQGKTMP